MRHYFKEGKTKKDKLFKFCEKFDADYIEDGMGVWKIPKKCGDYRSAIAIDEDANFRFGKINESCDNFEPGIPSREVWHTEEAEWLVKVLPLVKEYKRYKVK